MLPQVLDKNFIIYANEFIKQHDDADRDEFIAYLREFKSLTLRPNKPTHKDACKGFAYVKCMFKDNVPKEKWKIHSGYVFSPDESLDDLIPEAKVLKRNSENIFEDENPPKKRRNNEATDKNFIIKEYFKNFTNYDNNESLNNLFPFPEDLENKVKKYLSMSETSKINRILIAGNQRCGKTTFIRHIANKYGFQYTLFNVKSMPQFTNSDFWIAAEQYLENHEKVLLHIKFNRCSSKIINNFDLEKPLKPTERIIIVYECNDCKDLYMKSDKQIVFPITRKSDREKMIQHFLQPFPLEADLTYEMISKWTPGFEIDDIQNLSDMIKHECKQTGIVTKSVVDIAIKEDKESRRLGNLCVESPNVNWSDIGGHEAVIKKLRSIIKDLANTIVPSKMNGVLLHGPPGCGKTMLAKALSNDLEFNFISVCCTDILNKYQGESEKNVLEIFNRARSSEPCILFIDEIDALCSHRDSDNGGSKNTIVNVFLTQLDGIASHKNSKILVLGATNFKDRIDSAIARSGRLGIHIEVTLPESDFQRVSVLMASTKNGVSPSFTCAEDIFREISLDKYTKGWNHAELADLISRSQSVSRERGDEIVSMSHVKDAYLVMKKERISSRKNVQMISPDFDKHTDVLLFDDDCNDNDAIDFRFSDSLMNEIEYIRRIMCQEQRCIITMRVGGRPKSGKTTYIRLIAKVNKMNLVTFKKEYFKNYDFKRFWTDVTQFKQKYGGTIFHVTESSLPDTGLCMKGLINESVDPFTDILIIRERNGTEGCDIVIDDLSQDGSDILIDDLSQEGRVSLLRQCISASAIECHDTLDIDDLVTHTDHHQSSKY